MHKKIKKEKVPEPEEIRNYRNGKPVSEYESKKTTRRNLLIFLPALFVAIYLFCVFDANQEPVQAAEPEVEIYLPGNEEPVQAEAQESQEKTTSALWQGFHPEVLKWEEKIIKWAGEYNLDPNLAATVMQIESCGWQSALSGSGAIGLFQVMPYHFKDLSQAYNPGVNARTGLRYLKGAYQKADNKLKLTFAMYNGGHYISTDSDDWVDETVRYSKWGKGIMNDIASGLEKSPTLQRWYANGGESLCQKAIAESASK